MLTLTRLQSHPVPLEAECLRPDALSALDNSAIARLTVWHGRNKAELGDFFAVTGSASDGEVVLKGDCSRVKLAGSGMTAGLLKVEGPIGMHAGTGMRGGTIRVEGDADDWLGAEMFGGTIVVTGNAGHHVGAAYRGALRGMRGGEIIILGSAGDELASTMRRGLIVVAGDTGVFPGINLLAGTVIVLGRSGVRPGAAMRRGSLLFPHHSPELLPTYRCAGPLDSVFPALYFRYLENLGKRLELGRTLTLKPWNQLTRHSGDHVALGKGEILCPA